MEMYLTFSCTVIPAINTHPMGTKKQQQQQNYGWLEITFFCIQETKIPLSKPPPAPPPPPPPPKKKTHLPKQILSGRWKTEILCATVEAWAC